MQILHQYRIIRRWYGNTTSISDPKFVSEFLVVRDCRPFVCFFLVFTGFRARHWVGFRATKTSQRDMQISHQYRIAIVVIVFVSSEWQKREGFFLFVPFSLSHFLFVLFFFLIPAGAADTMSLAMQIECWYANETTCAIRWGGKLWRRRRRRRWPVGRRTMDDAGFFHLPVFIILSLFSLSFSSDLVSVGFGRRSSVFPCRSDENQKESAHSELRLVRLPSHPNRFPTNKKI